MIEQQPASVSARAAAYSVVAPGVPLVRAAAALLVALLLFGGWLRIRHLGALGLAADEGNQALAVQGILEHGVPRVDSGRLYIRGIPFLYLESGAASAFGMGEFALRLPAAAFGVLAILLTYWAGLPLVGRRAALLAAAVMACSSWEIEMSRYARFYTPFQCAYVLAIGCFARAALGGGWRWLAGFAAATALAFSLHELSVMLALVPLIPLLLEARTRRAGGWAIAGAAGMVGVWFVFHRLLGTLAKVPGMVSIGSGRERRSGMLGRIFDELQQRLYAPELEHVWTAAAAHPFRVRALAAVIAVLVGWLLARVRHDGWRSAAAVPILLAAAVHQFGLAALFLAVYLVAVARRWADLATPALRAVYAGVAICAAFWVWTLSIEPHADTMLFQWLVGYPHAYQYFFRWFVQGWPVFLAAYVGASLFLIARVCARREQATAEALLLGAVWVPVAVTSFLENEFYAARYAFHVYPFMVLVVAWVAVHAAEGLAAARGLTRAAAAAALTVAIFGLLEDAHPVAAWRIGDRTYMTTKDPVRGHINWNVYAGFHQDLKNPALYVRDHRQAGEPVIAFGPPHKVAIYHFYTGPVDYSVEEHTKGYQRRRADGTIRDHITNSQVLQDVDQLRDVIAAAPGGLWLLGDTLLLSPEHSLYSEPMKAFLQPLIEHPDIVGGDGRTFAVRVRAAEAP